jgi:hypothetical protein
LIETNIRKILIFMVIISIIRYIVRYILIRNEFGDIDFAIFFTNLAKLRGFIVIFLKKNGGSRTVEERKC